MWIEFFISALVIVFAGIRLTVYADILGNRLNCHKARLGIVLLGLVTSLPEAVASITAVRSFGAIDLAVGNIVGSNCFNPLIIVLLDVAYRKGSVTNQLRADVSHTISAMFSIILSAIVLGELFLTPKMPWINNSLISLGNVLVVVTYFLGIKILSGLGKDAVSPNDVSDKNISMKKVIINLLGSAILVVIAAVYLAKSADRLAESTGLGETFFGSIFLAIVTSLPEIVVSFSALKIGSLGLAVGNIFGSNMINVFILTLCGFGYPQGSILAGASQVHIFTIILSIILVSIAVVGMNLSDKKKIAWVGWDSILMFVFFVAGMSIVYQIR